MMRAKISCHTACKHVVWANKVRINWKTNWEKQDVKKQNKVQGVPFSK